jgi:hypothetical protein
MLRKQPLSINFSGGVDLKNDPWQISAGKFLSLNNSVFTTGGRLTKRNGYSQLSVLPSTCSYLTTLNDNLTAVGNNLLAYDRATSSWVTQGPVAPMSVSTLPLVRNSINQTQCDAVIALNGLVCVAYTETQNGTTDYKYTILDSATGQSIVAPTAIPVVSGAVSGSPRVFLLGNNFVLLFSNSTSLQVFIVSSVNPTSVSTTQTLETYIPAPALSFDGVVVGNALYFGYSTSTGGQAVAVSYITTVQVQSALSGSTIIPAIPVSFSGYYATIMSLCADTSLAVSNNPIVYVSFWQSGHNGYTAAVYANTSHFVSVFTPQEIISTGTILNLASAAQNNVCTVFSEVQNAYGYDSNIPTHYINAVTVSSAGSVGTPYVLVRSVGLASKAFVYSGVIYVLTAYQSPYQPTYFLINGSTSTASAPAPVAKLAWENGGGYLTLGLPAVTLTGGAAQVPYLYKDLVEASSTATQNNSNLTTTPPVYSQTGINLGTFDLGLPAIDATETAGSLQLSGGFLWMYDGVLPVEQNFLLFPDSVEAVAVGSGGAIGPYVPGTADDNDYYYVSTYEWTDNKGNIHRSAPSIPAGPYLGGGTAVTFHAVFSSGATTMTVSSATGLAIGQYITDTTTSGNLAGETFIIGISGTTITINQPTLGASAGSPGDAMSTGWVGSNDVYVPTARLTYKIPSPAKIIIYRWSTAQPEYHQVTSLTAPVLNNTTVDYITFLDTLSDYSISGNSILYTTGGVVEDVGPPATNIITQFDDRVWLVDAEDQNLLWFSKQVIEGTPVEMSDLLTYYVAPSTAAQGPTGPITALAPMDDKLIVFKRNAVYYINGTGPDNTGENSAYSQPIFVTSTVGCANQQSLVMTDRGLMFQSDKGIWLLGRDLAMSYAGADVEAYNSSVVTSAVCVPGTTQVRFTLSTGQTLMYDYFYSQWGTFTGVPAVSACVYQDLHTFINSYGATYQELPGSYIDGSNPVLMSFTTAWLKLAGLQGYQRAYFFYLLGEYLSPHVLQLGVAYDYNPSIIQAPLIRPQNFSPAMGLPGNALFGQQTPFGGPSQLEQWRVFLDKQRCQSIQLSLQELYDPTLGVAPGPGLTLSGVSLIAGVKSVFRTIGENRSVS